MSNIIYDSMPTAMMNTLINLINRHQDYNEKNKNIDNFHHKHAAMLLRGSKILSYGFNNRSGGKIWHAEIAACRGFLRHHEKDCFKEERCLLQV